MIPMGMQNCKEKLKDNSIKELYRHLEKQGVGEVAFPREEHKK